MLASIVLIACGNQQLQTDKSKKSIVATTGFIGQMAKSIAGDSLGVKWLMGPGVDPHLYKSSQSDISALQKADLVIYHGLHLEGKMAEMLEKLASQKEVYAVAEALPKNKLIAVDQFQSSYDPHVWFDAELWAEAILPLANKMSEVFPEHSSYFLQNAMKLKNNYLALHAKCLQDFEQLSREQKIVVTAHDAFQYFGRAYGVEVIGLQGLSTSTEFGLKDVNDLVELLCTRKIKAVFVENSVSKAGIEAVIQGCQQKGHQVTLGGILYSDALGELNSPEGDYIGAFQHNVNTMINALR